MVLTMCQYNLSLTGAFSGGISLILGLDISKADPEWVDGVDSNPSTLLVQLKLNTCN